MGTVRAAGLLLVFVTFLPACQRSLPYSDLPDLAAPRSEPDLLAQTIPDDLSPTPDTAPPCAAESTLTVQPVSDRRPLDVILVVDNAPTMTSAIVDLERSLNGSFADPLSKSAIDYRIILISRFGSSQNQGICIGAPLTGNNCGLLKGPPVNGPRLFHYDMDIQGQDSLDQLLVNYRRGDVWGIAAKGWSGLLRQNAFKFFVVVSDGDAVTRGGQFLFNLRVTDNAMFGAGQNPNFVFHVVVGSKGTWGPKDPLQIMTCGPGVNNAGLNLQELAIMTGGLRYPICDGFNVTLKDLAKVAIDTVKPPPRLPCETDLPIPPPGMILTSMTLDYLPSAPPMVPPVTLRQAQGALACMPSSFYLTPKTFALCPDTCAVVQKDSMGQLQAVFCWNRP